jgi:hypothetical protein
MQTLRLLLAGFLISFSPRTQSEPLPDSKVLQALVDSFAAENAQALATLEALVENTSPSLKHLVYIRMADLSRSMFLFTAPSYLPGPNKDKCNYSVAAFNSATNSLEAVYACIANCDAADWTETFARLAPTHPLPHYLKAARLLKTKDPAFVREIILGNIAGPVVQYPLSKTLIDKHHVAFDESHSTGLIAEQLDKHTFLSVLHNGLGIGLADHAQLNERDRAIIRAGLSMNFLAGAEDKSGLQLNTTMAVAKWLSLLSFEDPSEANRLHALKTNTTQLMRTLIADVKQTNMVSDTAKFMAPISTNDIVRIANIRLLQNLKTEAP